MALTLDEANRIAAGVLAKAEEMKIRINVAVCDTGGRLMAFQRMDGARWAGVYGAQGKAIASAAFGRPGEGGHMIMGQGAVPIIRDGIVEGACGVGGGTAQEDEDCARAGVDLL